jgi:hypothetical protein
MIDPAAAQTMQLASELLAARDVIKRQRKQLFGLAAALRTQQMAVVSLTDLLDELLAADG